MERCWCEAKKADGQDKYADTLSNINLVFLTFQST